MSEPKPGRRRLQKAMVILAAAAALLAAVFLLYTADYYRADDTARAFAAAEPTLLRRGALTVLPAEGARTALIFYPGAKVEADAYLPLLAQIRSRCGITCILVRMPFRLAVLDAGAAGRILDDAAQQFPEIETWLIGGHSMGGAMAADYAGRHPQQVAGLLLFGAYRYGSYPLARTLTVYGSLNTTVAARVDYTQNVVVIAGGNHAQFGNYGPQRGDAAAQISAADQQRQAADAAAAFLRSLGQAA